MKVLLYPNQPLISCYLFVQQNSFLARLRCKDFTNVLRQHSNVVAVCFSGLVCSRSLWYSSVLTLPTLQLATDQSLQ